MKSRQVCIKPDGSIQLQENEIREPKSDEVVVKTHRTLISAGTELGNQELKRTTDYLPGYSNAGRVAAVGSDVNTFAVGDRVLSLGKHASYVTVKTTPQALVRIPQNVSYEDAAFGVLGSVAMHGIRKAKIELGEYIAISGMGLVGQLALQIASGLGCEALISVDLCDMRLELAGKNGADHVLNPGCCDLRTEIDTITKGKGLDCIIEASGYPRALISAFDLSRIGGRIVLLGSIWHRKIEVDFMELHEKELTLIGCHQPKCPVAETIYFPWTQQYNRRQMLRMIDDGRINAKPLITHRFSYTSVAEAYRLLREEKNQAIGVILEWE